MYQGILFIAVICYFPLDHVSGITTKDVNMKNVLEEVQKFEVDKHPDVRKWMDQCEQTVGKEEWRIIKSLPSQIYPCIRRYIKPKVIQEEIEDSMERGELDIVFKKYCGRKEKILNCLYEPLELVKPCLNVTDLGSLNTTEDAIDAGAEFVCSEDGGRIALFLAEGGVDCVKNHTEALKECARQAFPSVKMSKEDFMATRFDRLLINEDNCQNISVVHNCVVEVTSQCDDPTPSNLLDSLLTQALKVTSCTVQTSGSEKLFNPSITYVFYPYTLTMVMAMLAAVHVVL